VIKAIKSHLGRWCAVLLSIGGVLAILNSYYDFLERLIPAGLFEPNIQGIWLSEYSYPVSNGSLKFIGTTEYFRNKKYNFVGEAVLNVESAGSSLSVQYYVDGAGVWQADSKTIHISLSDMESSLKSVSFDGEALSADAVEPFFDSNNPIREITIPSGTSEEQKIIDISEDMMTIEKYDPAGNVLKVEMIKQTRRFQR